MPRRQARNRSSCSHKVKIKLIHARSKVMTENCIFNISSFFCDGFLCFSPLRCTYLYVWLNPSEELKRYILSETRIWHPPKKSHGSILQRTRFFSTFAWVHLQFLCRKETFFFNFFNTKKRRIMVPVSFSCLLLQLLRCHLHKLLDDGVE